MCSLASRSDLVVIPVSNLLFSVLPVWTLEKPNLSSFDETLLSFWKEAVRKGLFRYELNIQGSKVLPGRWGFLAELNIQRGSERRSPQDIRSMNEPFDPKKFNFSQVHPEEILFELKCSGESRNSADHDILAINVSPINEGHCLLLPTVNSKHPQILTEHGIFLSIQVLLMSKSAAFRVVFNSLCAYASVNHLHLHTMYINHSMLLEALPLCQLSGPCLELINYPARGFAFECVPKSNADIIQLSSNVYKLTHFLQTHSEAHNVCMTRARAFSNDSNLSAIRVFVWARAKQTDLKTKSGFSPAACELFGYILYKVQKLYDETSEGYIASVLENITSEPFDRIRPLVEKLFSDM